MDRIVAAGWTPAFLLAAALQSAPSSDASVPADASAQADAEAARAPAGRGVARVNGEELSLEDFRDWLVRTHGWRHLDDFVDLALLRQEAVRCGLPLPTDAEVEAAFAADWQDQVLWRYRGDEAAFLADLAASGLDRQGYRDRRLGTLEQEIVADRILRARPPTEAEQRQLWQREFGPDGVKTHLRVAFFDKLGQLKPGGEIGREQLATSSEHALAAAKEFLEAVKADPARFAELVKTSDACTVLRHDSIPIDLRARGGELPRLHADHFGGALAPFVGAAKSGDFLGPIATPQGYYVVLVVERVPMPFEAAGPELAAIWREREPSQGEIHWLKQELRGKASIERLPLCPPR